ncbi:hypothetical protein AADW59_00140 [Candidatus Hodgkinia cicadicola]
MDSKLIAFWPGSDISGVPASLTRQMLRPELIAFLQFVWLSLCGLFLML